MKKNMAREWIEGPERSEREMELEKQLGLEKQKVEAVQKQLEDKKKEETKPHGRLAESERKHEQVKVELEELKKGKNQLVEKAKTLELENASLAQSKMYFEWQHDWMEPALLASQTMSAEAVGDRLDESRKVDKLRSEYKLLQGKLEQVEKGRDKAVKERDRVSAERNSLRMRIEEMARLANILLAN